MDTLTRRRFLIASGVAGGAAVLAGSAAIGWRDLAGHAAANPLPSGAKVLVVVTLYGGNDGLNTVVPYADPAYHGARPELAYTADEVIRLDPQLGLNPAMTGLAAQFRSGRLAIVNGVGYPNPDYSHFRSMDIWQTASPAEPVGTGWIGRWLDASGDDPVRAVNVGSVLPPLAVGSRCTAAALNPGGNRPLPQDFATGLTALAQQDRGDTPQDAMVTGCYRAEREVAATFASIRPAATGSVGGDDLAGQLDTVGRCVKAGVPTRVYAVDLGGFDTHADEKGTQQTQLGTLDTALSSFVTDMAGDPRGRGVVVLVYSEFGRRVAANASQGTDHGSAGPVLVAGVPVRGGRFYGEQPGLNDLDDGNLKYTVDFRTVYAELLERVLDADPQQVIGYAHEPLGLLA
ncbi:MAG: DUF1501 domain-containing protein [Jatrophihabitans sp.]|nr:MAG: DUF1501 domain-containing protein [Jatrophihabitans sp.]